jgi:hypothetical protein
MVDRVTFSLPVHSSVLGDIILPFNLAELIIARRSYLLAQNYRHTEASLDHYLRGLSKVFSLLSFRLPFIYSCTLYMRQRGVLRWLRTVRKNPKPPVTVTAVIHHKESSLRLPLSPIINARPL